MNVDYYHVYDPDIGAYVCYDLQRTYENVARLRDTGMTPNEPTTQNLKKLNAIGGFGVVGCPPSFRRMCDGEDSPLSEYAFFRLYGERVH